MAGSTFGPNKRFLDSLRLPNSVIVNLWRLAPTGLWLKRLAWHILKSPRYPSHGEHERVVSWEWQHELYRLGRHLGACHRAAASLFLIEQTIYRNIFLNCMSWKNLHCAFFTTLAQFMIKSGGIWLWAITWVEFGHHWILSASRPGVIRSRVSQRDHYGAVGTGSLLLVAIQPCSWLTPAAVTGSRHCFCSSPSCRHFACSEQVEKVGCFLPGIWASAQKSISLGPCSSSQFRWKSIISSIWCRNLWFWPSNFPALNTTLEIVTCFGKMYISPPAHVKLSVPFDKRICH